MYASGDCKPNQNQAKDKTMVEDLPAWISAPLIAILGITMLYQYYILPGYIKDKKDKDNG